MRSFREFIESNPLDEYGNTPVLQGEMAPEEGGGLTAKAQAIMADPQTAAAVNQRLDQLQQGLDIIGLEPSAGTFADITNVGISGGRAWADPERRVEHIKNLLISLASIIPFGDIAKLLKGRGMRSATKGALKGGRRIRTAAQTAKAQRAGVPAPVRGPAPTPAFT